MVHLLIMCMWGNVLVDKSNENVVFNIKKLEVYTPNIDKLG